MNCRQVSSLLSAYLDAELTGTEMLEVRAHLETCRACRTEHETLRQTKHLLAALSLRAPRPDFEALLRADLERAASCPLALRWLPAAWRGGMVSLPRPRPLMTAAALSLTTLFLATTTVHSPPAGPDRAQTPRPAFAPSPAALYPAQYTYLPPVPLTEPAPLVWNGMQSDPLVLTTSTVYGRPSYRIVVGGR